MSYHTPVSGDTVVLSEDQVVIIDPAGLLLALTIQLHDAHAVDGRVSEIVIRNTVVALTWIPPSGHTLVDAPAAVVGSRRVTTMTTSTDSGGSPLGRIFMF